MKWAIDRPNQMPESENQPMQSVADGFVLETSLSWHQPCAPVREKLGILYSKLIRDCHISNVHRIKFSESLLLKCTSSQQLAYILYRTR